MILVVDDDLRNRFVIADMLKRQGYEVAQASNALEALKAFSRLRPDVVITDLRMPEIDGADLALQIHANWPGIGVILASGYFTGKVQKIISAAWADFIYKPIEKELLLAKIQRLQLRLAALKT
jgi:CheY-like chemotaxis protein